MAKYKFRYGWLFIGAIVVLCLPFLVNYLILRPRKFDFVGADVDWLSFWGSYLSSIVSAGVAFVILYIQRMDNEVENEETREENEKQNNANRQLQYNALKYQQELSRLENFIGRSSKLIASINPLTLKTLCKQIQQNNTFQIENYLLTSISDIKSIQQEFCLCLTVSDLRQKRLGDNVCKIIARYTDAQCDIQNLLTLLSVTDSPIRYELLKEYALSPTNTQMSDNLKNAIINYTPSQFENARPEWMWEGIALSIVDQVQGESTKLYNEIDDFVLEERSRIEKILTDGI